MAKLDTLTALDIGTSKVVCAIAECTRDGELEVVAKGVAPCSGMQRGSVIDCEETVRAIEAALAEVDKSGYAPGNVVVGLSSEFVSSRPSHGQAAVDSADGKISQGDIARVLAATRQVGIPSDCEVVKVVPCSFSVDNQQGIANPIGLAGTRFEARAYACIAAKSYLQNIRSVIAKAGLDIHTDGMLASSMASALAVLTDDEKKLGAMLADIGLGTVDLSVYQEKEIGYSSVLGLGGSNLAYDVAQQFNIPIAEAERLILEQGIASKDFLDGIEQADADLEASSTSGEVKVKIKRSELAEVIEARLLDIFEWLKQQREFSQDQLNLSSSGVVFTGGTSQLPGLAQLASRELEIPVRIASPCYPAGLPQWLSSPIYSTVVGLLLYGAVSLPKQEPRKVTAPFAAGWIQQAADWLNKVF